MSGCSDYTRDYSVDTLHRSEMKSTLFYLGFHCCLSSETFWLKDQVWHIQSLNFSEYDLERSLERIEYSIRFKLAKTRVSMHWRSPKLWNNLIIWAYCPNIIEMILKSTTFSLLGDASFLRDKQCGQMRSRLDSNHLKLSTFQLETVNESTFHDPPGMFELLLVKSPLLYFLQVWTLISLILTGFHQTLMTISAQV